MAASQRFFVILLLSRLFVFCHCFKCVYSSLQRAISSCLFNNNKSFSIQNKCVNSSIIVLSFRIRRVRHVFIHGDVDIYNIKFCCFHSVANRLRSSSQFTIAATGCTSVPNPTAQNRNLLTFVKTVQAFASFRDSLLFSSCDWIMKF